MDWVKAHAPDSTASTVLKNVSKTQLEQLLKHGLLSVWDHQHGKEDCSQRSLILNLLHAGWNFKEDGNLY